MIPAEAMGTASGQSGASYLVRQFWAFYDELVALKRRLGAQAVAAAPARPEAAQEPTPEAAGKAALSAAQSVNRQLIGVLELQAIEAQRAGGRYALDVNHEAQYAMAALADEILLNFEWPGRNVWTSCLIEEALFGSRIAGDRIFERLEELLRTRDPARRDLALVYLLMLSLGFEGRYRGTDCAARMQAYRAALYRFAFGRDPDPSDRARQISPQAYAFTVSDALPQQIPHVRKWITILLLVIVSMLGLSQLIWQWKAVPLVADILGTKD